MKIKEVFVLEEAEDDLDEGREFYNTKEFGVGEYFWDSVVSDIESLIIYAGIHKKKFGLYKMFAKRFPYVIYYEVENDFAYVVAVLPMRRDPIWIAEQIGERR
ncbi:MAG: type II toxin-antitoxin system RelE/ParE family toxin [Desulfotignum sp.]|jgi:hypothetical protein|nr:type II toxin-antitoxin system RelE/ParE family toxin [Desulfotignum sp.]MCF8090558.1 type II toxin-antitoxin system RelE/ParE family toxin [Desulfotignum sp.]